MGKAGKLSESGSDCMPLVCSPHLESECRKLGFKEIDVGEYEHFYEHPQNK